MVDEKIEILHPETIEEAPFPGQEGLASFSSESRGTKDVSKPQTVPENQFPDKRVAVELISSALNTKSRKILAEFEFTRFGALQIGVYDNGVSGDIRISPSGIVGRNISGITTFAIDGETGDAVFAGTIQAGALISGAVIVGNNDIVIDGDTKRMLWYNAGIPGILIGSV